MGIRYKIKPEIEEFILAKVKSEPKLGCRKLVYLVKEQFDKAVSKSSISSILKANGLNKPIGRPQIHKKRKPRLGQSLLSIDSAPRINLLLPVKDKILLTPAATFNEEKQQENKDKPMRGAGYWFIKAAELCFGGIQAIAVAAEINRNGIDISNLIACYETLLYMPLFGIEDIADLDKMPSAKFLNCLIGKKVDSREIREHLNYIESSSKFNLQALNIFSSHLPKVCGIKFIAKDDTFFLLDADSHSIWSTLHIPADFSSPMDKVQSELKNAFLSLNKPLIIQSSPGFSQPPQIFFDFIKSCSGLDKNKLLKRIELYNQGNYLLDTINIAESGEHFFIMGLWPWQYEKLRLIEYKDDFRHLDSASLDRFLGPAENRFSFCEGEISLKSEKLNEEVKLRSISIKRGKDEFLVLITNIKEAKLNSTEIVHLYLERWPNLEEGCQYFLNKIKLSTYVKDKLRVSEVNLSALSESQELSLERMFGFWRIKLNEYCQNSFFPPPYKDLDILRLKEQIYEIGGRVEAETGHFQIKFNVQSDYKYLNDLEYACRRVNEKNIVDYSGKKLYFDIVKV